jgi:hypothetical protein
MLMAHTRRYRKFTCPLLGLRLSVATLLERCYIENVMKKNKPLSYEASSQNLKRFFSGSTNADAVTVEDIFQAVGRSDKDGTQNRSWLSNKLTSLYHHKLVTPVYSTDGQHRLTKIRLTEAGKRAVQGVAAAQVPGPEKTDGGRKLTIEQIMDAVPELQRAHPSWEIVFTVNPKKDGLPMK